MKRLMKNIPGIVVAFGLASLLTDLSSEMIYPLLPIFLTTVLQAGALSLGVIEGVAETTASILKVASGIWADRVTRRKPMVVGGYAIAGIARPLIGLAPVWPVVLMLRFADRVGKGLRTSPRDSLIADSVAPEHYGQAYGFQRMMDHAGAVLGPLTAAALLTWAGLSLRAVFLLAAIPAVLVIVVLVVGVREVPRPVRPRAETGLSLTHWGDLSGGFKLFLGALLLFTLGNSTDAFILLRLSNAGVTETWIAILWALHHVVKMSTSYIGGSLSDSLGRRRMIWSGWALYGVVYLCFALFSSPMATIVIFLIYGVYYGLCEPVERAWVVDLAPKHLRGTALGYYHGIVGIGALPASLIFGGLWEVFGAPTAFICGAAFALLASFLLMGVRQSTPGAEPAK